jgi:hypothetical protein
VVLVLLGLLALALQKSAETCRQIDRRLDLQLEAQSWLERMAADLQGSARQRLYPERCEMDIFSRSDLVAFDPKDPALAFDPETRRAVLTLSAPLGTPEEGWRIPLAAYNFERSEQVAVRPLDERRLELTFASAPQKGDRILVEYPVDAEVAYWREAESGVLWREARDSQGATDLEALNPPGRQPRVLCQALAFNQPGPGRVAMSVTARSPDGQSWSASLEMTLGR